MKLFKVDKMAFFLMIFIQVTMENLHILAFAGRRFSGVITKTRQALLG